MNINIQVEKYFAQQVKSLDKDSQKRIKKKIELIKKNPYRFKHVSSDEFSKVFRVRLSIQKKELRLIYVVIQPNILLVCLLERKNDYKDLEIILKKVKKS